MPDSPILEPHSPWQWHDHPPADIAIQSCDVLVLGGGGAGLAAACAAAALGRSVVLLEKNRELGGSTSWSVGSVSATQTKHQKRHGIQDDPQAHWEDYALFSGAQVQRDNLDLARVMMDRAPDTFQWLLDCGLRFVGPMPEPPHRVPRMHNVLPNSRAFAKRLGLQARKLNVHIATGMSLVSGWREGAVLRGLVTRGPNNELVGWSARGGIVLAAGDFSASKALKGHFAGSAIAAVDPINPGSGGDGIGLGIAAGGRVVNGENLRGPFMRFLPPPSTHWVQALPSHPWVTGLMAWAYEHLPASLLRPFLMRFVTTALAPDAGLWRQGGILIDREGNRIDASVDNVHAAVAKAPQGMAYVVFGQALAKTFAQWPHFVSTAPGVAYAYLDDYRRTRPDLYFEADGVSELAQKLQVSADRLANSLSGTNFEGKQRLVALGPAKAYIVFTNGGLEVSKQLEVLDQSGHPLPGLYAAGSNGQGGMLLEGHGHHLLWAFVSGRLAGQAAAARV